MNVTWTFFVSSQYHILRVETENDYNWNGSAGNDNKCILVRLQRKEKVGQSAAKKLPITHWTSSSGLLLMMINDRGSFDEVRVGISSEIIIENEPWNFTLTLARSDVNIPRDCQWKAPVVAGAVGSRCVRSYPGSWHQEFIPDLWHRLILELEPLPKSCRRALLFPRLIIALTFHFEWCHPLLQKNKTCFLSEAPLT